MASVSGSGGSVGDAFRAAAKAASLGHSRSSYDRTSTLSRFHQLFQTQHGYDAMRAAGLEVKQKRTLEGWLDGTSHPNKANAEAINRAYKDMQRGGLPGWFKKGQMSISGQVGNGNDVRDRGSHGHAPLRVELSGGNMSRVESGLDRDGTEEVDWDELAGDLVDEDLPSSGGWEFPGSSYSVTVSG